MTKQITIYDLLPFLETGWVAMDKDGTWFWYGVKPIIYEDFDKWMPSEPTSKVEKIPEKLFDIAPFDGDWEDSLIKIDHFHQQGKMVKEEE